MKFINEKLRAPPQPVDRVPAQPSVSAGDCGLLLVRLAFGLLMAGHGCQKLFGIFGGEGLTATGKDSPVWATTPERSMPPSAAAPSSSGASAWLWDCSPRWHRLP